MNFRKRKPLSSRRPAAPPPELASEPPVPGESVVEANARRWRNSNGRQRAELRELGRQSFGSGLEVDYRSEVVLHNGEPFKWRLFQFQRGKWMDPLARWLRSRTPPADQLDALDAYGDFVDAAYPFLPCGRSREEPSGDGLKASVRRATYSQAVQETGE